MNIRFSHPITELLFLYHKTMPVYFGPITHQEFLNQQKYREYEKNRAMVDLFVKATKAKYDEDVRRLETVNEICIECEQKASSICTDCGVRICATHIRYGLGNVRYDPGDLKTLCLECKNIADVEYENQLFGDNFGKNQTADCYGL